MILFDDATKQNIIFVFLLFHNTEMVQVLAIRSMEDKNIPI